LKTDLLYFLILVFLVFNNIPQTFQVVFISGILQTKLVFYPIFVALIYTLYYRYRCKNTFTNFDKFVKFSIIYLSVIYMSLIIGFFNYPYYDLILNGPITQVERLSKVINILNNYGIYANEKMLITFWVVARTIKGAMFEVLYTFGGAYMIYCWYHNNWQTAFNILVKAVLVSLIIIFGYCFVELFYLAGNEIAKNILVIITPYLHIIKSGYGWWPPLLLSGQLRSIFAEPSYYGIYFAFAMPMLWYVFCKCK